MSTTTSPPRGSTGSAPIAAAGAIEEHRSPAAVSGGLVVLAATALLIMAMVGEVIPPIVVFVLLLVGTAVGLHRMRSRAVRWAAVVLPLLLILVNLPVAIPDLSHPESPGGFVPTSAVFAIALTTAWLALRFACGARVAGRAAWSVAAGVVVLGTAASMAAAAAVEDDTAEAGDVVVTAADVTYPELIEVDVGAAVVVDNEDLFRHTFVVEGTDVAVEVEGATVRRITIDLAPGTYSYVCDVPGHERMRGALLVG